ncbi:hypothetical protein CCHR01_10305 [Colletotrichum chrysophilum]|uniref:Uncharacterized protein n=1 Tax=Colletotrichum chrysophilum TaxID=1836956 RepID=A0AAD9EGX7_9PEZI|nr:hypothetical protein CCHR01_10305 [Colletotrichum chrysophilum]
MRRSHYRWILGSHWAMAREALQRSSKLQDPAVRIEQRRRFPLGVGRGSIDDVNAIVGQAAAMTVVTTCGHHANAVLVTTSVLERIRA